MIAFRKAEVMLFSTGLSEVPMAARPLQPITAEHAADYARDGVVCVRGMFSPEWVARMRALAEQVMVDPARYGNLGPSQGEEMTSVCYMTRQLPAFRDLVLESPAGEITGRIIGAKRIRLYHDHLFAKAPGSPRVMKWHIDATAWPVSGEMAPNLWIALSQVTEENGRIEFVAGHHRYLVDNNILYGFKDGHWDGRCPDFQERRGDPDTRFLTWNLAPGDAVLFHPYTPHFSLGNRSTDMPRVALALRMFGDDVRWNYLEGKAGIPGLAVEEMVKGQAPDGPLFPVLWENDRAARAA
jgi:ectoine hydroxylase-related dioxygenase (phytanoyl-CoA dioxygenase family)